MNNYKTYKMPETLTSCYGDINFLFTLFENILNDSVNKTIILDFQNTHFFAAELYFVFHENIKLLKRNGIIVNCCNVKNDIDYVMHLSNIYTEEIPEYNTSIKHKSFIDDLNNDNLNCFDEYIANEFDKKSGLSMTANLYLRNFLSEIFINSRTHGKTNNIFFSGQIYNKINKLSIVIFDTGVSIPYNVENFKINNKTNYYLNNDGEAIRWANQEGNTTKNNSLGGLGLFTVKNFIIQNDGNIQIFSRFGFFYEDKNINKIQNLCSKINGTITILELKINKLNTYKLNSKNHIIEF